MFSVSIDVITAMRQPLSALDALKATWRRKITWEIICCCCAALFPWYNAYSWVTLASTWSFPLPFSWVSPRCMCATYFLNSESPSCYHLFSFLFNDTVVIMLSSFCGAL